MVQKVFERVHYHVSQMHFWSRFEVQLWNRNAFMMLIQKVILKLLQAFFWAATHAYYRENRGYHGGYLLVIYQRLLGFMTEIGA